MIVVLTGSNEFLLKSELNSLVSAFTAKYGDFGLQRIDGQEASYDTLREALQSLPFLADKKLVVLRAPGANKEFVDNVEKLLASVSDSVDVVIIEHKLDKRSAYYKYLKKNTEYKEFNELDESALARWLVDTAKGYGSGLNGADARYLVERVGANQQLLSNEIMKLAVYSDYITRETIDLLIEPNPQSTIFQLVDAAFAGNKQQVLRLYKEQRLNKVEPQQIIAMLAWQLHVLAVIVFSRGKSDDVIAREAKLSPFVVRKSRSIVNKLPVAKLQQLVDELVQLDFRLKTQGIDADDATQTYLVSI